MRTSLVLAATAVLCALVGVATPADAACTGGDTTCSNIQFTVTGGVISINAPTSATASSTVSSSGGSLAIDLGNTVVTDLRVPTTGWSVTATASDFTTSGGTIPKTDSAFSVPNAPTSVAGCTSFPTRVTTPLSVNSSGTTPAAILTCTAVGTNNATYNPRLTITIPASSTAGVYTGTVTQSAS
ncbi:MAG: hypothetical protein QOJ79_1411 [Actinomycetota bacterium]|jgi:hypothetical protein|nr:hypothetical protein [Actinomycetota bacterium]